MALNRLPVVLPLIAEQLAKRREPLAVPDETIPIVVTALVPEMPEQRAIRFVQLRPPAFALGIVGFRDVDRDDAAGVPRQDGRRARRGPTSARKSNASPHAGSSCLFVERQTRFRSV